jgi:hypothetical protein
LKKTHLRKPQKRRDREETQKEGESVTPHLDPIGFLGFGLRAEKGRAAAGRTESELCEIAMLAGSR